MTGFGSGRAPLGDGRVCVDVRSVNHRFLDVRVRLPQSLVDHAGLVEDALRERLERGRIEAIARIEGASAAGPSLDFARARSAYRDLCVLRDELRPDEPVPLALLAHVPDLFTSDAGASDELAKRALVAATQAACEELQKMRKREGLALGDHLADRLGALKKNVERMRGLCPTVVDRMRVRLRERVERLLGERDVPLDPGRLEHEVVLYAERSDVAEEIARLGAHCAQFEELMRLEEPQLGRRLDFLLQEMAREVNTLGAKIPDAETTPVVIEMKADVERMREQVQNVL
jgi:uncharacterized protein (TIGR00255 family)